MFGQLFCEVKLTNSIACRLTEGCANAEDVLGTQWIVTLKITYSLRVIRHITARNSTQYYVERRKW